jgi:hypothetical protein
MPAFAGLTGAGAGGDRRLFFKKERFFLKKK